jgi:hypothetical protein
MPREFNTIRASSIYSTDLGCCGIDIAIGKLPGLVGVVEMLIIVGIGG